MSYFTAYLTCTPCAEIHTSLAENSVITISFHTNNTFPVYPSTLLVALPLRKNSLVR